LSAVPLHGVTKKRAEFLSLGVGKSVFLYWKFLIVVNPHFPDAPPRGEKEIGAVDILQSLFLHFKKQL